MSGSLFHAARKAMPQSLIGQFVGGGDDAEDAQQHVGEFVACLIPLLNAHGWRGDPRHVAEAVPHFANEFDLEGFRNVLANLNLTTTAHRVAQNAIDPDLLPCLFVPDSGPVRVLVSTDETGGLRLFDGRLREYRDGDRSDGTGTAFYLGEGTADSSPERLGYRTWLGQLTRRFRPLIAQALAVTLLFNLLSLASALFVMAVYDRVIPSGSGIQLIFLVVGVVLAAGFEALFRTLRARLFACAAGRIDHLAGVATFQQVLFLPAMQTESAPIGTQIARLREFESVRDFFTGPLGESMLDLPFILLFVGLIAAIAGPVVVVPVTLALLFLVTGAIVAPAIRRLNAKQGQLRAQQQRFLIETLGSLRTLKLLAAEDERLERHRATSAEIADTDFRMNWLNQAIQTLARTYMMAAGVAVISFGAIRVMNGDMTSGALIATMILTWRALAPLQSAFTTLTRLEKLRSIIRHINALMRLPVERRPGTVPPLRDIGSGLLLSNVSFRYGPDRDPVVLGVSLQVQPGEIVAITGHNGSGKSTLLKLAGGLYRAQGGTVLIDGVDIRQIDAIDLRQRIGISPQVPEFFHGTVSQNLRMAVPTASDKDIAAAARKAQLLEEVLALRNGFETRLTDTLLEQLSSGFKRKLSLARAYLRNAPVLLLDEPAQSLDETGDRAFLDMLRAARGKQTVLMTTHRPSHMRAADRLVVLGAGRVLYNGPPAAFIDRSKETAA
jgi:ATP-binding cassette, subfamily C, bacterial LapB